MICIQNFIIHILQIFVLNYNLLAIFEQFYCLNVKTKTDFNPQVSTLFFVKRFNELGFSGMFLYWKVTKKSVNMIKHRINKINLNYTT